MHTIILVGRITKDAEMRFTNDGKQVSNFDLAVDDGFGDNKQTIWFKCSVWGKRAESLTQYLTKGLSVTVSGRLSHNEGNPRTWESKDGTRASFEVFVNDIALQGGKKQASTEEEEYF